MKKTIVALLLGTLVLSGCGWLHSDKSWNRAKQENPLEIPPNMNRPNVSDALSIPTVNAQQERQASTPSSPNMLHLDTDVDSTYKRVGLALGNGDFGTIASQSDSEHTYQVAMTPKMQLGSSQSFMQKHFSNAQGTDGTQGKDASAASGGAAPGPRVVVQVKPAAGGGSDVSATGDPQAVARLMTALKARLGG
jgi:uncharacterized lipoprotein